MRVSIAMAVYNGEKYLSEQIDSILPQLSIDDELVISYDESIDSTWNIINDYAKYDRRVKVVRDAGSGFISNFDTALKNCSGRYIFFSDQDDIWKSGKVELLLRILENENVLLVVHNALLINQDGHSLEQYLWHKVPSIKPVRNILRNRCLGCCMAFKEELRSIICPIPQDISAHDVWAVALAGSYGKVLMYNESLIFHRIHDKNTSRTHRGSIKMIIYERYKLIRNILKRKKELKSKWIK